MKVSARQLAQFCCREGDIHYRYDESTRAEEGIATQKRLQRERLGNPEYQREVSVQVERRVGRRQVTVAGRIDGFDSTGALPVLEEYKATRTEPEALHRHAGAMHTGQLKIYAGILAAAGNPAEAFRLKLIYCHPDTLATMQVAFDTHRDEALTFLDAALRTYTLAIARLELHRARRNRRLASLDFPYGSFRGAQRTLARSVYRTARDGGALIAEAPTGAGKTAGVLFPTLRAMGEGLIDRTVFLTSRGTGAHAAEVTLRKLHPPDRSMRSVMITAKHKVCFQVEPVCDPNVCEFAAGYYDRAPAAVAELNGYGFMDRAAIEATARAHRVCPFELSLDAAVWADVTVCDYNYVFDPVVRLQRLQGITQDRTQLLVDEAHQLGDRVRDALSAAIDRDLVSKALEAVGAGAIRAAIERLDRQMMKLKRSEVLRQGLSKDAYECIVVWPAPLLRSAQSVLDALGAESEPTEEMAEVRALGYALARIVRTETWYAPERFAVFLRGDRRHWAIEIRCLDPGPHIGEALSDFHGHVRFSATLRPLSYFARLHGVAQPNALQLPSPFAADQLEVLVVRDVSVRFRDRSRSLDALLHVIEAVTQSRTGNYIVALPSFEYLQQVVEAYRARSSSHACIAQHRDMDESLRKSFIDQFEADPQHTLVGFVVLGGVFAESVDLPGDRLIGMVVVGLGLPPPSLERQCLAACFGELGSIAAYEQPAMTRIVQAAGRIIRTENDRGVLCLVDDRYLDPNFSRYLPAHWHPRAVRSSDVEAALYTFWNSR